MKSLVLKSAVVVWTLLMIATIVWLAVTTEGAESIIGFQGAALSLIVVGAILTLKQPSNPVGLLALVAGSAWITYLFGIGYGMASLGSTGLPGTYVFAWMGGWVGALFPTGLALLILVFPSGRPIGLWRFGLIAPVVGTLSTAVGAAFLWGLPISTLVSADLVSEAEGYVFVDAGFLLGFFSAVLASLSVVARFRVAGFVERQQIKWVLAAIGLFALAFVAGAAIEDNTAIWQVVGLAMAAIPLAILFAVLRYRLYDIDRLISRTVPYLLVVGVLAAVFFGVVTAASSFLETESDLAIAASTLAVAALFNPVRKRMQGWVDRRFNRSRYNAQLVVDEFAGTLREQVDSEEVVDGWVGVVAETMQPAAAGVWVRESA